MTAFTHQVATCRECGCDDDHACPGGCYWVERDLCSVCAAKFSFPRNSGPAIAAYREAVQRPATLAEELADLRRTVDDFVVVLKAEASRFAHNVIAHPFLVLWPRAGRWLHERTEP